MQVWMPFSIRHCGMPVKVVCLVQTISSMYIFVYIFSTTHKQRFRISWSFQGEKDLKCPYEVVSVQSTGLIPLTHSKKLRDQKFLALSNRGISKKLVKSRPLVLASLGRGELVDCVHQVRPLVPRRQLCQQVRHPLCGLLVPGVGEVAHLPVVRQLLLAVLPTVAAHPTAVKSVEVLDLCWF